MIHRQLHQLKTALQMLRVQFERAHITLDGHVDGIVVRDLGVIEFDINPGKIVPGYGVVRRYFHETFIIRLRFHKLLFVGIDSPEVKERQDVVGEYIERMLELGFRFVRHGLRRVNRTQIRVVHGERPIHFCAEPLRHLNRLLHLD
ncbi:MAG: hypothetical protein JW395_3620 [Nitrospira sp.]|nr:hypothetical protein [Nitrospira sp.]